MTLHFKASEISNQLLRLEEKSVKVAVASGKGGTGKTTVATNLAAVAARSGVSVHLVDCDVDAPNCHLFVRPTIERSERFHVAVPQRDESLCTGCGKCADVCQFTAIACIRRQILFFPGLCHGCGACRLSCPEQALKKGKREVGVIEHGVTEFGAFSQGRLRVGEAMSRPLIRRLKESVNGANLTLIDCPPGTSCPVIEAVKGTDYVLLVAESTPFGLADLQLTVDMLRKLKLRFGVVINRGGVGDRRVERFCRGNSIPLLLEIAEDRRVGEAYSRGELALRANSQLAAVFSSLNRAIRDQVERGARRCRWQIMERKR